MCGGGESKAESKRFLLAKSSSVSASFSISVSRVTMIGRLTGRFFLPKVKLVSKAGYRGIGDTRTVRSVMVRTQQRVTAALFIFRRDGVP